MKIIEVPHLLVKPTQMPYSVIEFRALYGCDFELIATKQRDELNADIKAGRDVLTLMADATRRSGFELKDEMIVRFGVGEGVTVAQLLAESLSDMHTYPEIHGCAQLWLDYCCFERDNTDKGELWWKYTLEVLKPKYVVKYPTIYAPVHPPEGLIVRSLPM